MNAAGWSRQIARLDIDIEVHDIAVADKFDTEKGYDAG